MAAPFQCWSAILSDAPVEYPISGDERRRFAFAALTAAGTGVLAWHSPWAAFWIKSYTGFLFYGRSSFQIIFLCAWLAVVLGTCALSPRRGTHRPDRALRWLGRALRWVCAFMLLLNAGSFVWYAAHYELGLTGRSVAVSARSYSSTALHHIHTMKPILGLFAQAVGSEPTTLSGDSGEPFAHLLPLPLYLVGALLLVAAIPLFSLLAMDRSRGWPPPLRLPLVVSFGIASFGVLKWYVDGGFFNPFAATLLITARAITRLRITAEPTPRAESSTAVGIWQPLGLTLATWAPLSLLLSLPHLDSLVKLGYRADQALVEGIVTIAATASAALLPLVVSQLAVGRHIASKLVPLGLCLVLSIQLTQQPWYRAEYTPLSVGVQAGQSLFVRSRSGSTTAGDKVGEIGGIEVRKVQVVEDSTVLSQFLALGLRTGIASAVAIAPTCTERGALVVTGEIKLLQGEFRPAVPDPHLISSWALNPCPAGFWCSHYFSATLARCIPRQRENEPLVIEQLRVSGAELFLYRNEHARSQGLSSLGEEEE